MCVLLEISGCFVIAVDLGDGRVGNVNSHGWLSSGIDDQLAYMVVDRHVKG